MQAVLSDSYPKAIMTDLALYTQRALEDLSDAFPDKSTLQIDNILHLEKLLRELKRTTETPAR